MISIVFLEEKLWYENFVFLTKRQACTLKLLNLYSTSVTLEQHMTSEF